MVRPLNLAKDKAYLIDLAARLTDLADELEFGRAWSELEAEHDRPLENGIGPDGLPLVTPDFRCSYKGTLWAMRDLAESARRAAANPDVYPTPQKRPALAMAANGFLWLRYEHGFPLPSLYDEGDDVREFGAVCTGAGLVKSPTTLRNALSAALKDFDRHMRPGWVHYVLTGDW